MKKSGEYYPVDIENKDKRAAFFDTLNKYFSELHQIYNTGDSQGAADLSNRLDKLYASDLVQEFLKQVDKVAQKAE